MKFKPEPPREAPEEVTVRLLYSTVIAGVSHRRGAILHLSPELAAEEIRRGSVVLVTSLTSAAPVVDDTPKEG